MSNITDGSALQGWTSSPNSRGSMNIVWSCVFTMFLCTWSVLCVNISPLDGGFWRRQSVRKLVLACACTMIPDFFQFIAIGQWESACRSLKSFHSSGYSNWTMKHAFLADMGGFVLETKDGYSWPLDAYQLHYLIAEGWIKEPMLSNEVMIEKALIEDKNKTDSVIRVITCLQALWFVINCVARSCQHLMITTLEITTLGNIATAIAVVIFWAHKPSDVRTPLKLKIEATVADICSRAGSTPADKWHRTPLDYVTPDPSWAMILWSYHLNILRKLHLFPAQSSGIIRMRRDDDFPEVSIRGNCFSAFVGSVSFGINLVPYNFHFPTDLERYMWRASAFTICTWALSAWFYQMGLIIFFPRLREHMRREFISERDGLRPEDSKSKKMKIRRKWRTIAWKLRNISPDGDPAMTTPLVVLVPALLSTGPYVAARAYVIVEDLIAFRALPQSAYKTVQWAELLFHF